MAGATPIWAFPYPTGTDRVMDGDNAIQALAEKIEARLRFAAASLSVPGPGSSPLAVTFPAGRFATAPAVVSQPGTGSNAALAINVSAPTATGFTAYFYGVGVNWTSGPTQLHYLAMTVA